MGPCQAGDLAVRLAAKPSICRVLREQTILGSGQAKPQLSLCLVTYWAPLADTGARNSSSNASGKACGFSHSGHWPPSGLYPSSCFSAVEKALGVPSLLLGASVPEPTWGTLSRLERTHAAGTAELTGPQSNHSGPTLTDRPPPLWHLLLKTDTPLPILAQVGGADGPCDPYLSQSQQRGVHGLRDCVKGGHVTPVEPILANQRESLGLSLQRLEDVVNLLLSILDDANMAKV